MVRSVDILYFLVLKSFEKEPHYNDREMETEIEGLLTCVDKIGAVTMR